MSLSAATSVELLGSIMASEWAKNDKRPRSDSPQPSASAHKKIECLVLVSDGSNGGGNESKGIDGERGAERNKRCFADLC